MASPGYQSTLKVSGASAAAAGEATTNVTGNVYQITNAARRVIDPTVAVVVYDGVTPVVPTAIDYLFGKVTLPAPPGGAVTLDVNWLAMLAVAEVRKASLKGTRAALEDTAFGSASPGSKTFKAGLGEWESQAELFAQPTDDLDAGVGGSQSFFDFLNNGTAKLLEVLRAGKLWRGWCLVDKIENSSERDGLVMATVGFKGAAITPVTLSLGASLMFEEL